MNIKQAQTEAKKLGNFSIKAMSGGYCAVWFGKTQLMTWVTPEQALAIAQDCANTVK
jgi:hypothetical protein